MSLARCLRYNSPMRHYLGALVAVVILAIPWSIYTYPDSAASFLSSFGGVGDQIAAIIISHNAKTLAEIQSHYYPSPTSLPGQHKVRILLVPGHEPDYGGAEYSNLKERNMTVEIADDLKEFLQNNGRFQVYVTRDTASWDPLFTNYFKDNWNNIQEWIDANKADFNHLVNLGQFHPIIPSPFHNSAPKNVAMRLYGIEKWANENNIDIILHLHFNDYPGHSLSSPGEYSGFTIYVPQNQYYNATTTHVLAGFIKKRLEKFNPVSDLPQESKGVVEDSDLIAVGAYNSVDAASMLVEYGYIYESQFTNPTLRSQAIRDMAFQTYLGLQDFFDPRSVTSTSNSLDTLIMPHLWNEAMVGNSAPASEVFALQTALLINGSYPPGNKSKNDCPRTGTIGPCTREALRAFQNKYGITGEDGTAGQKTIQMLNQLYSGRKI